MGVTGWELRYDRGVCYKLAKVADMALVPCLRRSQQEETILTKLSVLNTFVFVSTTASVADVPILADPTQWLESIVDGS